MKRRDVLAAAPLAGLAAVTAGAVPVAARELLPGEKKLEENPALLALGARLPEMEGAYRAAADALSEAWRIWSPQWPSAPDAVCNFDWWGWGGRIERDLSGTGILRPGRERSSKIYTISEMENHADRFRKCLAKDDRRKTKASKKARAHWQSEIDRCELGVQLLPQYEAECERIKLESGYDALADAQRQARDAMFAFARKVLAEPALTARGVRIKAEACAALGRMQAYDRVIGQAFDSAKIETNMAALLANAMLEVI